MKLQKVETKSPIYKFLKLVLKISFEVLLNPFNKLVY